MAKKRIGSYTFTPGVSSDSNAYPNAYSLISNNLDYIKYESTSYISSRVISDTALNLYPNAVSLLTNNKDFLKDEITAWIGRQVSIGSQFTPSGALYIPSTGVLTLTIGGHSFRVGDAVFIAEGSLTFTCLADGHASTHPYPRSSGVPNATGTDPVYNYPMIITSVSSTGFTVNVGVSSDTSAHIFLGSTANSITVGFPGYTFDIAKCKRDSGYVLDSYIYDLRYGGNQRTISTVSQYWPGGLPAVDGDRLEEVAAHIRLEQIINDYIFTKTTFTTDQSPITSTQNTSGSAAESGTSTRISSLAEITQEVFAYGLTSLPANVYGATFVNYTYDASKCRRDVKYVLDAYLWDLRYNGNRNTIEVSGRYWVGDTPQVDGNRLAEVETHQFIRDLINDYIITNTPAPSYSIGHTQYINLSTPGEAGASTRITDLSNIITSVITDGTSAAPSVVDGVGTIAIAGKWTLDQVLLITNVTDNILLYNFADPTTGIFLVEGQPTDPDLDVEVDYGYTRLTLKYDTSLMSSDDRIQIFVEDYAELRVRPYEFGTDAIERHRVAASQSMLDADFEYGLQPTKWQAITLTRSYPSVYEVPGTDTEVVSVTTDASAGTGGTGQSLITVTTVGAHGFSAGTPISIRALANSVSGFSRAEGVFIVNTVPSTTTFTYYAKAKVGTTAGTALALQYTQLRRGAFYTGADIGTPTFTIASQGVSGSINPTLTVDAGVPIIPFTGTIPTVGAPISGTGIPSGTQVTAVNGSGSPATVSFTGVTGSNISGLGVDAEFDIDRTAGAYVVTIAVAGTFYSEGDQILIYGTDLGGVSPANDLLITVDTVDTGGEILTVSSTGLGIATGVAYSKTVSATADDGDSDIELSGVSGLSVGLAMNRGDGVATYITDIDGNIITLSSPLTSRVYGDAAAFPSVTGSNIIGEGAGAEFDVDRVGTVYNSISVSAGGADYLVGDTILITGDNLGGSTPANDLYLTVTSVTTGAVTAVSSYGEAIDTRVYSSLTGTRGSGLGTGAEFDVERQGTTYTNVTLNSSIGGSGYQVGDFLVISGTQMGGSSGSSNDIIIEVTGVDGSGAITTFDYSGTAPLNTLEFNSPAIDSTSGIGTGADFNITTFSTSYSGYTLVSAGDPTRSYRTITATNAVVSQTEAVFGSSSVNISNPASPTIPTSYLEVASDATLGYGTGQFTLEFRFRRSSGGVIQSLIDMRNSEPDTAIWIGLDNSNQLFVYVNGTNRVTSSPTSVDTWYHVALIRGAAGQTTLYLDGNKVGSSWTESTNFSTTGMVIGTNYDKTDYGFDGYIDELRSSKGIQRWSSGGTSFPLPTSAYDNDADTQLLLHFEGENNSTTFLDDVGGYKVGDTINILGTAFGGISTDSTDNDLTITVSGASYGLITSVILSGTAADIETWDGRTEDPLSGQGSGLTVEVTVNGDTYLPPTILGSGTEYTINDKIIIDGANLGGVTSTNDIVLTVTQIGFGGNVTGLTFTGTGASTSDTYTAVTGTNVETRGAGVQFTIEKETGVYTVGSVTAPGENYAVGNRFLVLGNSLGGSFGTNDAIITVTTVNGSGEVTGASITGTASGGQTIDFYSTITISENTTLQIAPSSVLNFSAIAEIQVSFLTPHGLVPGTGILVQITSGGFNQGLCAGPFYIDSVPTPSTLRYTARAAGTITALGLAGLVYTRTDSFFIHRPFDGGVQLGTGGPAHGAQAIRMSKNYIRYQSGKGLMYTTGCLFAPSYDLLSASSTGVTVGSVMTFTTDEVDHGLQSGAVVKISGISTRGYDGTYTVSNIISERIFTVVATNVLGSITGELSGQAQISVFEWAGATVRAGGFDEQNGMYWQYDGQRLGVGVRSSTFQLAGTVSVESDSNAITGLSTRFRDQLRAGDKIVIRGMTHTVTSIPNQTTLYMAPDYRGVNDVEGVKICKVIDRIWYQDQWNKDKADGTGPSGYNIDVTKMQMIGLQYSWYGAGFIDWMMRGKEGYFLFVHRVRNNNVNTEAFMRSANLPVRYEVINQGPLGELASDVTSSGTTLALSDATDFPTAGGIVYVDNELISYTGKSGNTLTGCTRSAPMSQFVAGSQRNFTAGTAASHSEKTGVIFVSNKTTPIISHWGSAYLTDGGFDSDRGYLFNYQATSVIASAAFKQTAFLVRLSPSVSNAIVGDLGERELINRAQLLLKGIEVTAGTGSASGIVIEGVLNPSNYPSNPDNVDWRTLSNPSLGGQPSFTQVALGNSVTWDNAFQVSLTATTGIQARNKTNYLDFTQTSIAQVRIGMTVSSPTPAVQAVIPGGMSVNYISGAFNNGGVLYRRVYFNKSFTGNVPLGASIEFTSDVQYAAPGETIFSFVGLPSNQTALDLTDLKELTNTAIGGRGMYPNGPDILAINCYLTGGNDQEISIVLRWSEAQA